MARLRSIGISPVFREASYSSWRGWARLLLHCFRRIAGNLSGPTEEFWEIVSIASMMYSLAILMSDSVFACGCQKKSFGCLIVIAGSGVLKTLLYCSFSSSLIFCCIVPGSPLHPGEYIYYFFSAQFCLQNILLHYIYILVQQACH